jgi:hypothetical protein
MWHVIITIEWEVTGGLRRYTYSGVIGDDEEKIERQSQLYEIALSRACHYAGFYDAHEDGGEGRIVVLYYSIEFEDISRYNQAVN